MNVGFPRRQISFIEKQLVNDTYLALTSVMDVRFPLIDEYDYKKNGKSMTPKLYLGGKTFNNMQ